MIAMASTRVHWRDEGRAREVEELEKLDWGVGFSSAKEVVSGAAGMR